MKYKLLVVSMLTLVLMATIEGKVTHSEEWYSFDKKGVVLRVGDYTTPVSEDSFLKILLKLGVNYRFEDMKTPLHVAAQFGQERVCKRLIEEGADIEARTVDGLTPLHVAATNSSNKVCKFLVSCGADVMALDNELSTPLHLAACQGNKALCEFFILRGADVNAQNSYEGFYLTPLHLAAFNGMHKTCVYLIDMGADWSMDWA